MTDAPKTLIVTGASRGIGACVAMKAHESGYRVLGLSLSGQSAHDIPYELRACDVSDFTSVKSALSDIKKEKNLWGLINTAGIASMNLHLTTPPETMQKVVAVNLLGTMYCCAVVGKQLARGKCGRIVNFSTIAVAIGLKGESSYCASKAGVEGFSRSFAREMADFGVTVNTIAPGPIDTDLIRGVPAHQIDRIVEQQIIPHRATLEDVWSTVKYLLSDEAAMLSGQIIHLGGA